jgi:hypothetical protein
MFRKLCRWEVGGTSGMVTDESETFRLDNLESEVVVGAWTLGYCCIESTRICKMNCTPRSRSPGSSSHSDWRPIVTPRSGWLQSSATIIESLLSHYRLKTFFYGSNRLLISYFQVVLVIQFKAPTIGGSYPSRIVDAVSRMFVLSSGHRCGVVCLRPNHT